MIKAKIKDKLSNFGVTALSDEELVSIISGEKREEKSSEILRYIDRFGFNDRLLLRSKAGRSICAALELVRRRALPENKKITSAEALMPFLNPYCSKPQEYFLAATLNGAKELIALRVITIGLANQTQIHPREIFASAITDRACFIILAHNHPSGNLEISEQDINITRRLEESGELLGIKVLDHIVFSKNGCISIM